jgi:serine/threonine-protein kinase
VSSIASGRGSGPGTPTGEFELAGRYRVVRRLGSGGAATVFLAQDTHLDRRVAIKRLHTGSPEDAAQRFTREAKVGASLNHPHLVTVFDTLADQESVLIVMEYVEGTDLAEAIRRHTLHEAQSLDVLEAVAGALDHAHTRGVIHRDVKPSNILVRNDGVVKLADLGIAKAIEDTDITHSGAVIGTLLYMSPEQLAGKEVSASSDLYSLALIAFELLSGERAREPGPVSSIDRQAQTPPDLGDSNPEAPPAAVEILRRALDPDPERRPLYASGFVSDLRAALQGGPVRTPAGRAAAAVPSTERADPPTPPPAEPTERVDPPTPPPAEPTEPVVAEDPPTGELAPVPEPRRNRSLAPAALAALIALLIAGGAIAALTGGGGGSDSQASKGAKTAQGKSASGGNGSGSTETGGGAAAGPTSSGGAGEEAAQPAAPAPPASVSPSAGDPGATAQAVYQKAAAGDYEGAWALTTGNYQGEVGGYSSFVNQSSDLESVTFTRLDTTSQTGDSATVEFEDLADHGTYTDHCSGSFGLVRSGGSWLLDDLQSVTCDPS